MSATLTFNGAALPPARAAGLGWFDIVRLGLVQAALGAIVALTTSTLNRVIVVEYGLPAMIPAALVAWHYGVQVSRARWGYGSDMGQRRTPWIVGGMAALAGGAVLAAFATTLLGSDRTAGLLLAVLAFSLIGIGVGASGTSLLALLASAVAPARRPAAAALTWILMIVGIVMSAASVGALLSPFSPARLLAVAAGLAAVAFVVTVGAVWGVERGVVATARPAAPVRPRFADVLTGIWSDPAARRLTIFIFVSMVAYSAQELILEPFAGLVFHYSPAQSASLNATQHAGVLAGMLLVGVAGNLFGKANGWMRSWTAGGCIGSAVALGALGLAAVTPGWPLAPTVALLGLANGVFAVAAIGSMMGLAGGSGGGREGSRMGLWGAAQAIAFAVGGFLGAAGVDAGRHWFAHPSSAFVAVFVAEAGLFLIAAIISLRSKESVQ